jgi:hypothetical protein
MILPCGLFCQIRKTGSDRAFKNHMLFVVDFAKTEADFNAGKFSRHDVTLQRHQADANPFAILVRALDRAAPSALAHGTAVDPAIMAAWSDEPDVHGNLSHPSMFALEVLPL